MKIYFNSLYLPKIYYIDLSDNKTNTIITIISGTHGNEPGPGFYFFKLLKEQNINLPPAKYYIIPSVNPLAIQKNVRSMWFQPDTNRSWPSTLTEEPKDKINKYLLPIIQQSDYILDFHEGWGSSSCTNKQSVGQTIYCSKDNFLPYVDNLLNKLNNFIDNNGFPDCDKWEYNPELDYIKGSLKEYTSILNIPYFLIEIKGQNNISPLDKRMMYTQIIFDELIKIIK